MQLLDPEPQGQWAHHSLSFLRDSEDPCVEGWKFFKKSQKPRFQDAVNEACFKSEAAAAGMGAMADKPDWQLGHPRSHSLLP